MLVILPNPILEFQHAPLPPKCCESRSVPRFFTLPMFHFKFTFESIKELGSTSLSCYHLTWKPAFHAMVAKVLQIGSWVSRAFVAMSACKKWIPIGLMGCMHTHWKMFEIEGWGNPNHVWSAMKKIRENNRKVGEACRIVSQVFALGPEHDTIWTQWALGISLNIILERVWWCRNSGMEIWSLTICCLMNYSNKRKHAQTGSDRRSRAALKCC